MEHHEHSRMRGEMSGPREPNREHFGEDFSGHHSMSGHSQQPAEMGRQAVAAVRERMSEMQRSMPADSRPMWTMGAIGAFAVAMLATMFFFPDTWRRFGDTIGHWLGGWQGGIRS